MKYDAIQRFAEGKQHAGRRGNLSWNSDELYSYGPHFILAKRGDWGKGINYLINGDVYSHTTSRHTAECICSLKPNIQIPFSALKGAGIGVDWNYRNNTINCQQLKVIDFTEDETWYACPICGREVNREAVSKQGWSLPHLNDPATRCAMPADSRGNYGQEGIWRHRLGMVVFSYRFMIQKKNPVNPDERDDLQNYEHKTRYFLSGFDNESGGRNLRSYFLCELPHRVKSMTEAYESLKPKAVKQAEAQGLKVLRQGEYFFVPTRLSTKEIKVKTVKMAAVPRQLPQGQDASFPKALRHLDGTGLYKTSEEPSDHVASQMRRNGQTYVRGIIRHRPGKPEDWAYRTSDHPALSLGTTTWWLPVINTAKGSWDAAANVD